MRKIPYLFFLALLFPLVCCSGGKGEAADGGEDAYHEISEANPAKSGNTHIKKGPRYHDRIRVNHIGQLSKVFNDSNYAHFSYAERLGINPIESLYDAYFTSKPLVKLTSCNSYEIDTLTHSMPYLVHHAERLLRDIGDSFIDSLESRGGDGYKIILTSALRTPGTVKKLRRVNRNATDSSTHMFGTTFDLSWRRFQCADTTRTLNEEDLKNLLAEVLLDKRKEGRCLVKYEQKTACFHITAIK